MPSDKIDRVRSSSSGTIGRAVTESRALQLVLDSSSRPQADALTNSEAFLGAVSSCGVTLVEMHAEKVGIRLRRTAVRIEGVRRADDLARFATVSMHFELAGVTEAEAGELVAAYRRG